MSDIKFGKTDEEVIDSVVECTKIFLEKHPRYSLQYCRPNSAIVDMYIAKTTSESVHTLFLNVNVENVERIKQMIFGAGMLYALEHPEVVKTIKTIRDDEELIKWAEAEKRKLKYNKKQEELDHVNESPIG